eukprot:TRINITY_DN66796_c8_g12_i2.p1 TRINITY_DN66796_c8_g12~~TRINITY_DN66796_c8_g12_i2.p1  ORF type:complete len:260 (-),score=29.31 TRINITY_DN66796_c8_g12_i2:465-1244(-)
MSDVQFYEPELASVRPCSKDPSTRYELLDDFLHKFSASESPQAKKQPLNSGLDGFIVDDMLSEEECVELVRSAAEMGYSFWNPNPECKTDYRNAFTVEITHEGLAAHLWQRGIADFVPPTICFTEEDEENGKCEKGMVGSWHAYGINPTLLFVSYPEGGHFSPHTDGYTVKDFNSKSLYSVIVYLNTCEDGGGTNILGDGSEEVGCGGKLYIKDDFGRYRWEKKKFLQTVRCSIGSALVFQQQLPHEGEPVGQGVCTHV